MILEELRPPNGSRLSCARRTHRRKALEPLGRVAGEATQFFPYWRAPASFKRMLGGSVKARLPQVHETAPRRRCPTMSRVVHGPNAPPSWLCSVKVEGEYSRVGDVGGKTTLGLPMLWLP